MYMTFKRFLAWGLFACLPLVIAGCGGGGNGGGGGDTGPKTTISGIATIQGPIKGAVVEVFQLKANGSPGELLGTGISAIDGRFAIEIPVSKATPPLLIKVSGQAGATYTSATILTPINFTATESFSAAVDKLAAGQVIAVSPLSDAGYKKLQQLLTADPLLVADTKAVAASNSYVASIFNVTDLLADPTVGTNLANQAALLVIDQMIADSGANTSAVMNVIAQAVAVAEVASPEYQNFLTALTVAGNKVLARTPPISAALATAIQALLANAQTPPANPDFSDTTAPTAPTNFTIKASTLTTSSAAADLSWTASTDNIAVTGYDIYRDGSKIATVKTPGYRDSSLIPGSAYTYYVLAFDGAGNRSAASSSLTVTPNPVNLGVTVNGQLSTGILNQPFQDFTPPTPPTSFTATTTILTATQRAVNLSWSGATDNVAVVAYEIYRDGSKLATVTTGNYTDTPVLTNTLYTYYIIALDAAGNNSAVIQLQVPASQASLQITVSGQLSTGVTTSPSIDITAPTPPTSLSATTTLLTSTQRTVNLSWSGASDNIAVTAYEIFRNGSKIATVATASFTDSPVLTNTLYTYYIIALDAAGNRSIASSQLQVPASQTSLQITVSGQLSTGVTTPPSIDITAPSAPANLAATTTSLTATQSSVNLSWSAATDNTAVTGYDVYRNGVKIATTATFSLTDTPVTPNVAYSYYIKAFDAAGNISVQSSTLSVTPPAPALGINVSGQLNP